MKLTGRYWKVGVSVLLGIGVFLFWWGGYPFALTYQEQYQLFLFTSDYFRERASIAGGLTDYVSDFIVQFYYIPWLGALLLALLSVALYALVPTKDSSGQGKLEGAVLPLTIPLLLLHLMGDESVLLAYMVSMIVVLLTVRLLRRPKWYVELLVVSALYWVAGPMCWLYVAVRVAQRGWRWLWLPVWLLAVECLAYLTVMQQWPPESVLFSINYYRTPMQMPLLMALIPLAVTAIVALSHVKLSSKIGVPLALVCCLAALVYVPSGFDADKYELIRQDQLIRAEQWDEVIERAEQHVVKTTFWSNSVNLALSQKRQLAERMFDFYQSGDDALAMPRHRDLTSNLPTAEAYYRLGLVNSAQRYMFDIQESILNGKKSGRCTKRIAECMIINGHYKTARKQLNILKHSLFYSSWAEEAERCLDNEAQVEQHADWARLRKLRFKDNFLFSYGEIEKIFGLLFVNNPENKMALDYFLAEQLLKGNVQQFMQYLQWAQQYGGYRAMPAGYQDAVRCIQTRGREGGKYGEYVRRFAK